MPLVGGRNPTARAAADHLRTGEYEPLQVIHPPPRFELPLVDLRTLCVDEQQREVSRLCRVEFERPFDLEADTMLRAMLVRWRTTRTFL